MSIGYTMPARDPEHGFLFPPPGARDERYLEATGAFVQCAFPSGIPGMSMP